METLSKERQLALRAAGQNDFVAYCQIVDENYEVNWHHELIGIKLQENFEKLLKGVSTRLILELPPRHGKEIAHSTPILTAEGWKEHGELKIGDFVFGRDGSPKKVERLFPESDFESDYIMRFSDGSEIYAHANHEWIIQDRRSGNKEKTVETEWLAKENLSVEGEKGKRGHRFRFYVDANVPIHFVDSSQKLSVHPYMLGVWLGDGCSSSGGFCGSKNDIDIVNKLKEIGYETSSQWEHKTTGVQYYYYSGLIQKLRKLNLFQNKHIPDIYKFSSLNRRLELLAGLIDTDGSRDKQSRYRFSTCNKRLAEDVKELALSLGSRAYMMEYEPVVSSSGIVGRQLVYQVGFNLKHILPVALKRKKNKRTDFVVRRRSIVSIERAENPKRGRCIQVEGGVYLVGRTLIPTHNSEMATIKFPSWALGKRPELPIIVASYSADLAEDFGSKTRDIMSQNDNYKALFSTRLRADTKAKKKWLTQKGGGYTAAGAGGAITGKGFRIGIVDDPFKNREEADSVVIRDKVWGWWKSTFYTRKDGVSMIVVITTRWHLDDLVGRLEKQEEDLRKAGVEHYDEWDYITFPAIAEKDEKYRKKGEALWNTRFPIEDLRKTESSLGMYEFSALYQQHPIPSENQEFRDSWFRYFDERDIKTITLEKVTIVDLAISEKEEAHNSVILTLGKARNSPNIYRLRQDVGKMNPTQVIDAIFNHYEIFRGKVWIELVAYQKALKHFIIEEQRRRQIYFTVNELKANRTGSKEVRIRGLVPFYQAGVIFHNHIDSDYERELLEFPKGRLDDMIDTMSSLQEAFQPTQYDEAKAQYEKIVFDPYA